MFTHRRTDIGLFNSDLLGLLLVNSVGVLLATLIATNSGERQRSVTNVGRQGGPLAQSLLGLYVAR